MKEYTRNFLGQPIAVGDEVVYIKNLAVNCITIRNCKCIGEITDISNGRAVIKCSYAESETGHSVETEVGKAHDVDCADIICKITDGVTFWWRTTKEEKEGRK